MLRWRYSQLHVWVVAAAEGKVDPELRVDLCELVQAIKLIGASRAGSHIHRYSQLMS
jgi:hypothetical protein